MLQAGGSNNNSGSFGSSNPKKDTFYANLVEANDAQIKVLYFGFRTDLDMHDFW